MNDSVFSFDLGISFFIKLLYNTNIINVEQVSG
jgi:hypothetical protein